MRVDRRNLLLGGAALWLAPGGAAQAATHNWPNWRGPYFNGASDGTRLPVKFSPTENVRWSLPMPGPAAASPIIWEDTVFVSTTDLAAKQLLALALDRATGEERWRHVVGTGYLPGNQGNEIQLEARSYYASPSPVTDGKRVIFFYGNGDLAAFDLAGKKLWARNLQQDYGDFAFSFTFSSSPVLYDGRLYMQVLQRNTPIGPRGKPGAESYLLAMDPATGKELWRTVRLPGEKADAESLEAYTTPIPFEHNGRKELLVAGADILTGHDPATGKELWRWGTYNQDPGIPSSRFGRKDFRLVPSPVAGRGMVLACAPKTKPVYAIKAGANGDVTDTGMAWHSEVRSDVTTDVPTPLFYRDRFYVMSDLKKALTALEPETGKVLWSLDMPNRAVVWGSPTAGDGKIYAISLVGEVHVIDAEKGEVLASNPMAEQQNDIHACVAIAGSQLFLRTNTHFYCVGKG